MKVVANSISFLTKLNRWIASIVLVFLMVFITVAVIGRYFNYPILGDVEIVQVCLVVLIMASLSYTEKKNSHISISLIVERLSKKVQLILGMIGQILTLILGGIIAFVFVKLAIYELSQTFIVSTNLLKIPLFPFKLFVAFGFLMWGLQALLKTIYSVIELMKAFTDKESEIVRG